MGDEAQAAAPTNDHSSFAGVYTLVKNENFDEFLAANGANWLVRKMATSSNPTLEITQDGDKFTITLKSLVMTRETAFTIGEEFEEKQTSGVVMKVIAKWEDKKLVMTYEPKEAGEAKPQKHTRELDNDELILTLEVEGVVAKRIFKKSA